MFKFVVIVDEEEQYSYPRLEVETASVKMQFEPEPDPPQKLNNYVGEEATIWFNTHDGCVLLGWDKKEIKIEVTSYGNKGSLRCQIKKEDNSLQEVLKQWKLYLEKRKTFEQTKQILELQKANVQQIVVCDCKKRNEEQREKEKQDLDKALADLYTNFHKDLNEFTLETK